MHVTPSAPTALPSLAARPNLDRVAFAEHRDNGPGDDGTPFVTYWTGEQSIGDVGGYGSLDDATRAASLFTKGPDVGAAAVLEYHGRFYAQEALSEGYFVDGPWQDMPNVDPLDLESPGQPRPDYFEFAANDSRQEIAFRALVDGAVSVTP